MTPATTHSRTLKPKLLLALGALLLLAMTTRCAGTDVGNPEQELGLEFVALTASALPQGQGHTSSPRLDEAWLAFGAVELRTFEACNGNGEQVLASAPLVVELFGGLELPATPVAMPDSLELCRLRLESARYAGELAGAPAELVGASVLLRGVRGDGAPFAIALELDEPIVLNARPDPDGHARFELGAEERRVLVAFDVRGWLDAEVVRELDALAPGALARVDAASAPALVTLLGVRVRQSVMLFRDLDQDGRLQPDEAVGPLADSSSPGNDPGGPP